MNVSYDWRIVTLSVVVACVSAYTALDLTGPAAHARGSRRSLGWTFAGTAALAIGVWSMHFIGMQAFRVALPLEYNVWIVAASFVLAFAGAMISLWWLVKSSAAAGVLAGASVLLGLCLAGMHYTGMAALAIPAVITYDPGWVALSVIIAIGTSYAAFRLAGTFAARDDLRRFVPKAWTAIALGIAIVSVHYTGMAGAHFYKRNGEPAAMNVSGAVDQTTLAFVVTGAALIILGLFLLSSFINTRWRIREREQARFRLLADGAPNMVWTADDQGIVDYANPRLLEYTGYAPRDVASIVFRNIVHPDDRERMSQRWEDATGSDTLYAQELRLRNSRGNYRWHLVQALAVRDDFGRVRQWVGSSTDIHEQKQAGDVAQFLDEIGTALSSSLDLHASLGTVSQMLCRYADWCEICYEDGIGAPHSVSQGRLPPSLEGPTWSSPLVKEQSRTGRLTLMRSQGPFSEMERTLFHHVALRLSVVIANVNVYQREHRVAQSFQEASLPAALPTIAGLSFDAVYVPGNSDANVGGDWYDAVRLLDGRVVVSIGDVAGSGLDAAVTMGNVRQIIRGIAQVHADPALMLDAVDRALRVERREHFVTAFVGVIDPVTQTLSYASAGHPPPMLRCPDGRIETLSDGGLPLGLRVNRASEAGRTVAISDGCMLVLYTDGLTEATRAPTDGERALWDLLARPDILSDEHPAAAIKNALLNGRMAHDDIAILVVALAARKAGTTPEPLQRWTLDVLDPNAAHRLRREFAEQLAAHDYPAAGVAVAEVVLGELLGNAVRHAPGLIEVVVDWSGDVPVLHVLDNGPGFHHIAMLPPDLYSESGRGLYIVSMLTQDFRVSRRPGGGSHALAVLAPAYERLGEQRGESLLQSLTR